MNETEFNQKAEAVFARVGRALDASDADIEWSLNQGILVLEFDDGSRIIVNRHAPNREIWVAAKSGGFHFAWKGGRWMSERDGAELFATLSRLLKELTGINVRFDA